MIKEVFTGVQNRLIAAVPELQYIDFDLGQTEQQPLPSLDYPAALMRFDSAPMEDVQLRQQYGLLTFTIRLIFRVFERTHSVAVDEFRSVGLQHIDLVAKTKWAIHGLSGDNFAKISHRDYSTEPRADLRVYALTFETRITDLPPVEQIEFVTWTAAGGDGAGPDLCIDDQDNPND